MGFPAGENSPWSEEAKNGSVYGYEEELLQKAWKDAAYGAALFVDPTEPGVEELLRDTRVVDLRRRGPSSGISLSPETCPSLRSGWRGSSS